MKIVVTVPTWNEIENIVELCHAILEQDPRIEVLVADDDSPDGTWQAVAELAAQQPRVSLLHRRGDRGRGRAGRAAFVTALQRGADLAFEMDADWSHHPRHLPAMIAALEQADAARKPDDVPVAVLRYDRQRPMAIMYWEDLLHLICTARDKR